MENDRKTGQTNDPQSSFTPSSQDGISISGEGVPESKRKKEKHDLQFVLDVPLEVTVELGKIPINIRDLLSLKKGSVLEMEKLAGEPLEILLNNKLVCRGEVIVINEKYGIRMTDIVKPAGDFDFTTSSSENLST